jgi:hypothetical protein
MKPRWVCPKCRWTNTGHFLYCVGCEIRRRQPILVRHVGQILEWLREAGLTV